MRTGRCWPALVAALAAQTADAQPADLAARFKAVQPEHYAPAPGYSEGPTWKDGEVFFCSGALLRITRDRQVRRFLDVGTAGTFLKADGHLLVCDNKNRALLELTPDGKVGVVVERFEGQPLRSLNDVTVDPAGNVYWTDPDGSNATNRVGAVFRVRPDGRVDRLAGDLAFPNGLDVDPAGKHLYVIESQSKKVLRYDLPSADKPLGKPAEFFDLGGSGGDGCVFDAAGNLWVADFSRPELTPPHGRVTVLSPEAKVLGYLDVPSKVLSNLTWGGAKLDELYLTTGTPDGVFRAAVGVPGFRGHPGRPLKVVRYLDIKPVDEPVKK
jgi:sugar lactone lactonase YvrE